jgi:hypothetical protein
MNERDIRFESQDLEADYAEGRGGSWGKLYIGYDFCMPRVPKAQLLPHG